MPKQILFSDAARRKMLGGVDILARRTRDRLRADANAVVSRQDLDALKLALSLGGAEQVGRLEDVGGREVQVELRAGADARPLERAGCPPSRERTRNSAAR